MNFEGYTTQNQIAPDNRVEFLPHKKCAARPQEVYNAKGKLVGFEWRYGDTIDLTFNTEGNIEFDDGTSISAESFLAGKTFKIKFYNHRYDVVFSASASAGPRTTFVISTAISKEFFKRGIYYCSLTLYEGGQSIVTTYEPSTATLYVK